ncbi:MAG TPA: TIGR03118 family protein [Flavisolibacter sp.]|jgi:uncharacterized protein (TIGR03118 family)|nr:TIGR03118 family protein [Flavisolibacter sp.]
MYNMFSNRKIVTALSFVSLIALGYSCQKTLDKNTALSPQKAGMSQEGGGIAKPPQLTKNFRQVNLVSSTTEYPALLVDPTLLNPWGLAFNGTGAIAWPASQASGLSQLYSYNPTVPSITRVRAVGIPTFNAETGGHPTGIIFNPTNLFKVPGTTARVNFIFAGTDGVISAWNGGTNAIRTVDNHLNSAYTGLANGRDGVDSFLYAADFRGMQIDVFNKDYVQVTSKPFADPNIPAGYAPFNIQNIDGMLYVTYAKVDPLTHESQAGEGFGYVDVFYPNGMLQKRLLSNGELNAPWGITKAPASFLGDENTGNHAITGSILLVGNFGDGQINAYTEAGQFLGKLKTEHGPIVIEGLWALTFPPGNPTTFNKEHLYFTAGPDDEEEGLFGYITK